MADDETPDLPERLPGPEPKLPPLLKPDQLVVHPESLGYAIVDMAGHPQWTGTEADDPNGWKPSGWMAVQEAVLDEVAAELLELGRGDLAERLGWRDPQGMTVEGMPTEVVDMFLQGISDGIFNRDTPGAAMLYRMGEVLREAREKSTSPDAPPASPAEGQETPSVPSAEPQTEPPAPSPPAAEPAAAPPPEPTPPEPTPNPQTEPLPPEHGGPIENNE